MQQTKKRMKTIIKQNSNSSKEDQNVVVVANPPGSLSNRCRCCHIVVAPLLHRYRSAVAPISLRCCSTAVAPAFAIQSLLLSPPLSLRCHSPVTLLSLRCCSAIAQLLLRCRSVAASVAPLPLLLLLLSLRCHFCYRSCCQSTVTPAVAVVSLWCRSAIVPVSVRRSSVVAPLLLLSLLLSFLLSLLLSLHCCCLDWSRSSPQEAESG